MAARTRRPSPGTRRLGYLIAVAVNAALLVAVNRWPGWEAVPFLTDDTRQVLDIVNASLVVSLAANVLFVVADPPWFKALGDLVTTSVSLAATVAVWRVFPFDFTDDTLPWAGLTRVILAVGIIGGAIGILVALGRLARELTRQPVGR